MLIVGHHDVQRILTGRARDVLDVVRSAYVLHDEGRSAVPHSVFLRFPGDDRNRIIALPAFVGGDRPAAGVKWISSFPDNIHTGQERASAAILLNALTDGRPAALVEGSLISAQRTAASAALAAELFTRDRPPTGVTLVGCGVINRQVLRFLAAALPGLTEVALFDRDPDRATRFAADCAGVVASATVCPTVTDALAAYPLISVATTAPSPHLDLEPARPGSVVLHISLRDLWPETILTATNVVDDADHVCREGTSLHLAEQLCGDRRFVGGAIGALLRGAAELRHPPGRPLVFSPFGLGVLDVALAEFVRAEAVHAGHGLDVAGFLPDPPHPAVPNNRKGQSL